MQSKKHVLEFFRKDPWPVRLGVLVIWLIFLLALAGLIMESVGKWPLLSFFLKRFG